MATNALQAAAPLQAGRGLLQAGHHLALARGVGGYPWRGRPRACACMMPNSPVCLRLLAR